MLIIVSGVAVDLLMDALTDIIRGLLTKIDVDALVNVNLNVFSGGVTTFKFAIPGVLERFCC